MDSASGNIQGSLLKVVPKNEPEDTFGSREEASVRPHRQHTTVLRSEQDNCGAGSGKSVVAAAPTAGSGDEQHSSKDEYDSSSRRIAGDGTSFEDQDFEHASKRPRRHRHTPEQVQMLESVFKYCPLPDRKLRQELSDALGMNEMQVKFWFQNRRIQMKALRERTDNAQLRAEIKRMNEENMTIREAINQHVPSFVTCSESVVSMQQAATDEVQRRRAESSRLREELEHAMPKPTAWPASTLNNGPQLALPLASAPPDALSLELAVGRHPATQEIRRDQPPPLQGGPALLEAGKMEGECTIIQVTEEDRIHGPKLESTTAAEDQGSGKKGMPDNGFWKNSVLVVAKDVHSSAQKVDQGNGFWKNSGGVTIEGHGSEHASQDEQENGSGKHVEETGSGEDQDDDDGWKKKSYRHTAEQIHQLELFFKRCAHPDQRQREQLSIALGLNMRQVKFWFQNRRNQMKTLQERHDNTQLRAEVDRLRAENVTIREAIKHHLASCSESASMQQQEAMEEHKRRIDKAWAREEVEHAKASTCVRAVGPPMAVAVPDPLSLELAVGRRPTLQESPGNGREQHQQPQAAPTLLEVALSWPGGISGPEKAAVVDLAESALQEILQVVQAEDPLWCKRLVGEQFVWRLDGDTYMNRFPGRIGMRVPGLVTEATRDTGAVSMSSLALLDALMDANKWALMFPSIVAKALTIKVVSPGTASTLDGALQLMYAELQVMSPLLQSRQMYFLRYCKQTAEKLWVIVDVSMDCLSDKPPSCLLQCRRRPSGCIIQDTPNGHSQVTWLEHVEVDYHGPNNAYVPFLSSGSAFGAKRWVCALQRYCEDVGSLLATNMVPAHDLGVVNTLEGRRAMLRLAKKMVNRYSFNVSSSSHSAWVDLSSNSGNGLDDVCFMTRDNSGDGVLLCAVTSTWLPFPHQRVFDYLRSEEYRAQRNVLANGSAQEMSRIPKSQHPGNGVSLLRVNGPSQSNILILQESWTDESGSLLVYMPVDVSTFTRVLRGEDPSDFLLLPSGFAIMPDGPLENLPATLSGEGIGMSAGVNNAAAKKPSMSANCLLTVSFQTVVSHVPSTAGNGNTSAANPISNILLNTMESMKTVSKIIMNTLQHIQSALESPMA